MMPEQRPRQSQLQQSSQVIPMCSETLGVGDRVVGDTINAPSGNSLLGQIWFIWRRRILCLPQRPEDVLLGGGGGWGETSELGFG